MGSLDSAARRDSEYGRCCRAAVDLLARLEAAHTQSDRSQRGLARDLGVSPATITYWFRREVWPDAGHLASAGATLGLLLVWVPRSDGAETVDSVCSPSAPVVENWWPCGPVAPVQGGEYVAGLIGAELAWLRVNEYRRSITEQADTIGLDRETIARAERGLRGSRWLSLEQLVLLGWACGLDLEWQLPGDGWRLRPWQLPGAVNDLDRHIPRRRRKRTPPREKRR